MFEWPSVLASMSRYWRDVARPGRSGRARNSAKLNRSWFQESCDSAGWIGLATVERRLPRPVFRSGRARPTADGDEMSLQDARAAPSLAIRRTVTMAASSMPPARCLRRRDVVHCPHEVVALAGAQNSAKFKRSWFQETGEWAICGRVRGTASERLGAASALGLQIDDSAMCGSRAGVSE